MGAADVLEEQWPLRLGVALLDRIAQQSVAAQLHVLGDGETGSLPDNVLAHLGRRGIAEFVPTCCAPVPAAQGAVASLGEPLMLGTGAPRAAGNLLGGIGFGSRQGEGEGECRRASPGLKGLIARERGAGMLPLSLSDGKMLCAFEQIFGANQQDQHGGGSYKEAIPAARRNSCVGQVSQRQDSFGVSAADYFMTEESCGSSSRPQMPPARCTSAAA